MPTRKPSASDEKPQIERFIEAAREAGLSEDPEEFERVFQKVMKPAPIKRPDQAKPGPRSQSDA